MTIKLVKLFPPLLFGAYGDPIPVGSGVTTLGSTKSIKAAYQDPVTWTLPMQKRQTFFRNNTIIKLSNKNIPAFIISGTFPSISDPYISDCRTPLSVPETWKELAEFYYGGNVFIGKFSQIVLPWKNNYCGVYPTPALEVFPTIIDEGNNTYTQ
jgi:hypothetical protein